MKKTKQMRDFLGKIPESNEHHVSQLLIEGMSDAQYEEGKKVIEFLDSKFYKGWHQELTFAELKYAFKWCRHCVMVRKNLK